MSFPSLLRRFPAPSVLLVLAALAALPLAAGETSHDLEARETLRASQVTEDPYLASPHLLGETESAPEQMIWIEGTEPTRTRVRASRRVDGSWSAPVTVEELGAGSRTGLHVVRLPGGDLLAAWAAFDGTDDEIHWSRWSIEEGWSSPRALTDDAYPDVTPRLVATADGALLAWSGYDGEDYRISLARWTGGSFEELPGPAGKGTARPEFQRVDGDLFLVWRQAAPRGWGMAAVGARGDIARSALAPITDGRAAEPPRIRREIPDGLVLDGGVSVSWSDGPAGR